MTADEAIAWTKCFTIGHSWTRDDLEVVDCLVAEVERLRGEVAALKARLDYPPTATP